MNYIEVIGELHRRLDAIHQFADGAGVTGPTIDRITALSDPDETKAIIENGEPKVNIDNQDPRDMDLAKRIMEIKPDGCECDIEFYSHGPNDDPRLHLELKYSCPAHFPLTSLALKAKGEL